MIADLSSLESVRKLASDFKKKHERLHLLMNNAGVIIGKRTSTPDGLETTFVVNYLSHFLLTHLLLDMMKSSAPARIVNVTSSAHFGGKMDFDDLQEERSYGASKAYSQSKLAQVLFTRELAKRLEGTGVTANCAHPGSVRTHWGDEAGALGIGIKIARPFMLSPEKGARTPLFLATSAEVKGVTGKYFSNLKEAAPSKESLNDGEARRLWETSLKLCGLP
jgi:NAD(P)-dependent dehydrogenase (short-subunit alcohol dehydrogenase family)